MARFTAGRRRSTMSAARSALLRPTGSSREANLSPNCYDAPAVAARTCIVTVTDIRGIRQSVEVTADTVF
jgi:hypothetical protein